MHRSEADLAITYVAEVGSPLDASGRFVLQGGAAEFGANSQKGFGAAANVTGTHTSSAGAQKVPINLITATFGPRFRWYPAHSSRVSVTAEIMVGEVNGFHGVYPAPGAASDSANALAVQGGGMIDIGGSHRIAWRVLRADWVYTQLPNSQNNIQNDLRLSAGVVFRFH